MGRNEKGCTPYGWLRRGTGESGMSQTAIVNLAAGLENRGKHVNMWFFWDVAHCVEEDPKGFIDWVGRITGPSR